VVNTDLVPEGHLFRLDFATPSDDSVRAFTYSLRDSTDHETVITAGRDFSGLGIGAIGSGLLPVISTPRTATVDAATTGFASGSATNVTLRVIRQVALPANLKRPGYPDDLTITFHDEVVDTSLDVPHFPAMPARFRIVAHTPEGDLPLDFRFVDLDGDGTLSVPGANGDNIVAFTYANDDPATPQPTWRFEIATPAPTPVDPPGAGDVFDLKLIRPLTKRDSFVFTTRGQYVDPALAREAFKTPPYVVPNPYVGSASFEPERFAVSGRGDRRMEFRGLPAHCQIRIYTVRGELVQTLEHDGSDDGAVPWDLRTKDNLDVAPGLYVFHVDGGGLGSHVGKFAIIK